MATFLFVHGAFQGGWVWRKAAALLRSQRHEVHTPTLSGCGYLSQDLPRERVLDIYINEMTEYLQIEDLTDVILVAHSFSGMICGAIMMHAPQRIQQAVFIDAVIPENHRSFVEIAGAPFQQMLAHHRMDGGQVRPWPAKVFGVDGTEAKWFESRLRPFSHQAFWGPFPGTFDPAVIKTSFIGCRQTMSPFIRAMAGKAQAYQWPLFELDTGHCPMITCPAELVQTINLATQPTGSTEK
jgi:pimeloyl-ACP methyl ester carboxylesterase